MKKSETLFQLQQHVIEIIAFVENEISSIEHDSLNWKESNDRWSILECLEHLNRYNRYYNQELLGIVRCTETSSNDEENQSSWLGRKFISMMRPDNIKKQKTLRHLNPIDSKLTKRTVDEFISHQRDLLHIISELRNKTIRKAGVRVEFFKLLKMPALDALSFVIVHEQRHMLQIKGIIQKHTRAGGCIKRLT